MQNPELLHLVSLSFSAADINKTKRFSDQWAHSLDTSHCVVETDFPRLFKGHGSRFRRCDCQGPIDM
jgi:hypothetical protein